jgi:predicted dienelactone hydrolase
MTDFLDIEGGRIALDVSGAGPLIVLAHGIGDRRQAYRFLAPALAAPHGYARPRHSPAYTAVA